jgi:HTTM domain
MAIQTRSPNSDSLSDTMRRFFYAQEIPWGLALIRIVLPLILLCVVIPRWTHAREFFSTDGAAAPLAVGYGLQNFPPAPSGMVAVAMMTGLAFCLVATSIGWHTRISLGLSWGLFTWLNMLDCLSTFTKYSVISSHLLFLLTLSNCGAIWSIDSWRRRSVGDRNAGTERNTMNAAMGSVWPRRLVQLLIGLIYFGAAFTKMHTDGFMSGDQIRFWLLTNMNNDNPLGEWLAMYPWIIVTMSHIAIIWQILFVFLSWSGRARLIVLSVGTFFHLSTIWLLGLFIFPPIMITTYFAWLNEDDVRRIRSSLQRPGTALASATLSLTQKLQTAQRRIASIAAVLPLPSVATFGIALTTTVVLGVELEYRVDHYGVRQPGGAYALKAASPERERELLGDDRPMDEADTFFSLEVGTETLGGVVVHRRSTFRPGDNLLAQCCLVPPHEDMWVECRLEDTAGRAIHEFGQAVTREMLRVDFQYQFPNNLESGHYRFVVHANGEDVLSRTIHVGEADGSILTN